MPWRDEIGAEHARRKTELLWRKRTITQGPQGNRVKVAGAEYLNFCSNDYLGLANHPELIESAVQATRFLGTGSGASHLICGHSEEHHRLENEIAEFVGAEKAIVFSTGYMANLAVPQAFLGRDDLVLGDRLNHASLVDGARYCDAKLKRYSHCDLEAVEKTLKTTPTNRKLVSTDGVFSMDGDIAPVAELKQLCDQYGAMLLVDDAHGFGVIGDSGIGSLENAKLKRGGNTLMIGTLGKAAGSFGAFVAGDSVYIESLVQFGRTYIYTTALPPAVVAATRAAIEIIKSEPRRREQLRNNVVQFRNELEGSGLELLQSKTPIQLIMLGTESSALAASEYLKQNNVWVTPIRPPTVPIGEARLRITLTANHLPDEISKLTSLLKNLETLGDFK